MTDIDAHRERAQELLDGRDMLGSLANSVLGILDVYLTMGYTQAEDERRQAQIATLDTALNDMRVIADWHLQQARTIRRLVQAEALDDEREEIVANVHEQAGQKILDVLREIASKDADHV